MAKTMRPLQRPFFLGEISYVPASLMGARLTLYFSSKSFWDIGTKGWNKWRCLAGKLDIERGIKRDKTSEEWPFTCYIGERTISAFSGVNNALWYERHVPPLYRHRYGGNNNETTERERAKIAIKSSNTFYAFCHPPLIESVCGRPNYRFASFDRKKR